MSDTNVKYDDPTSCNRCGGNNQIFEKLKIDFTMLECETTCDQCGFDDYWFTGHFESGIRGFNQSDKY